MRAGNRKTLQEIFGFGLAGLVALIVDLATFNFFVALELSPSVSGLFAALAALLVNYFINHQVFIPRGPLRNNLARKSLRFSTIAVGSFLYLVLGFEIALAASPDQSVAFYSLMRILLIGSGTAIRFLLLKYWVFPEASGKRRPRDFGSQV